MFEVLETARKVAEESRQVQVDEEAVVRFVQELLERGIEVPPWEHHYHFYNGDAKTVSYLLVLDSLNFCFWPGPGKEKWEIQYRSERLSGYYALAASLKRAVEQGIPITEAQYLIELSSGELSRLLQGQGELQLLKERLQILWELGHVLIQEYHGEAFRLVEAANGSAVALVRLVFEKIPSFRDVARYRDRDVFFYKRAQIFAADLYGAFQGKDWGHFTDMDKLTAFADYKLPQVLRHLRILRYGPELSQKVDQGIFLEPGGLEEVEIRANTIWTVELIRQEMERMGRQLRAFEIDWILWNMGQCEAFKQRPYHRTVTIYY